MSSHDEHEHVQITEDEVERFAAKLEEWGEQLPEEEKRLLRLMLSSALATAEASGDVEGFDLAVFSRQAPRTFSVATMDVLRPIALPFDGRVAYPDWADTR